MPPSRRPSSSHSSRPSRPSGSSHRPSPHHSSSSHYSTHHSSYHRSPPRHSGYSSHSGGGFFSGMVLGGLLSRREQAQNRSATVINQQIINTPQPKMYECPYCLGRVTGAPAANGLQTLTCPNCGGVLSESNAIAQPQPAPQPVQQSYASSPDTGSRAYTYQSSHGSQMKSCFGTLLAIGLMCGIALVLYNVLGVKRQETVHNEYNNGCYEDCDDGYPDHEDSIYVEELGRTCCWNEEYQCYYDSDTDCYFFENYDMDPPVWQYWFEGVSSNYGSDYGWLEWDSNENCWYVQKSNHSWVRLPEREYTDRLWHFD